MALKKKKSPPGDDTELKEIKIIPSNTELKEIKIIPSNPINTNQMTIPKLPRPPRPPPPPIPHRFPDDLLPRLPNEPKVHNKIKSNSIFEL